MAKAEGQKAEELWRQRQFQLCVFDDRRGGQEGQEADKVLAFFPPDTPLHEQCSVVGLVQAVQALFSSFSLVLLWVSFRVSIFVRN